VTTVVWKRLRTTPTVCAGVDCRPLRTTEVERFVDELWLPFARENVDRDAYDDLAADVRPGVVEHRRSLLADDDAVTLLAVEADSDGERWLGFGAAERRTPPPVFARGPECRLTGLYVRPDERGGGVGSTLLDRLEAWGRDRDCEHATLAVHPANEAATELYEAAGYETKRRTLVRRLD
jgi:GNAT superfamily N-acetyltransferase